MKLFQHKSGLPLYLREIQLEIEKYAREYGLDFFDIIYELLSYDEMNAVAAYGGFPQRYPHWRFGMEYEKLSKGYTYGFQKIYEMVINNDPCYAYLLEGNNLIVQKMVMAHVTAHCDFFKNNLWFAHTNRNMLNEMANHGSRIRSYMDKFGVDTVESFIDICLSIDNLIDVYNIELESGLKEKLKENEEPKIRGSEAEKKRYYLEEFLEETYPKQKSERKLEEEGIKKFPEKPVRDIMKFLLENAPLKDWQQDVLSMIREEAYYFAPQAQTKIMNEGWATYWHTKIMTEKVLSSEEIIDYADHASRVTASPGPYINPYKLGYELFKHIEERWNKGKFGKEWEECDNFEIKKNWDLKLGLGREKIFEVRKFYNDVNFIDEFLTLDFVIEQKLFTFSYTETKQRWEIESRRFEDIKKKLILQLVNRGNPIIYVEDGNFENRGELLLVHNHIGIDLRMDWAKDTLANIYKLWTRPVNLITKLKNKDIMITYNGKEHKIKEIGK